MPKRDQNNPPLSCSGPGYLKDSIVNTGFYSSDAGDELLPLIRYYNILIRVLAGKLFFIVILWIHVSCNFVGIGTFIVIYDDVEFVNGMMIF